ncbi:MAG: hypothetical protein V3W41_03520 [Planctomycetota bacterium]
MHSHSCRLIVAVFALFMMAGFAQGQLQVNGFFNSIGVDVTASSQVGGIPAAVNVFTDSPITVDIQAQANTPVVLLYSIGAAAGSAITQASFGNFNVQLDLTDVNGSGFTDQVLVDGYARPFPNTFTGSTGNWNSTFQIPACRFVAGSAVCISVPTFEVAVQAIVNDPVNSPFFISSTAAAVATFTNGFTLLPFTVGSDDASVLYNFPGGFTFSFYGNSYTGAWVSENGYIQFGTNSGLSAFPSVSLGFINNANPKIMSFFTDLVFTPNGGATPRIYAQSFTQNGTRKIKFVHESLQEFGNSTGPHGGEITITELGEIAVFVTGNNSFPTINTGVGILDGPHPSSQLTTAFGRDLTADIAAADAGVPPALGAGFPGFEHFDHGNPSSFPPQPILNPIDLIGVEQFNTHGVGKGITYVPDPSLTPFTAGYIIL